MKFRIIYDWEKQGLELEADSLEAAKQQAKEIGYNPLDSWEIPSIPTDVIPSKEVVEDWRSHPYVCSLAWFTRVYG